MLFWESKLIHKLRGKSKCGPPLLIRIQIDKYPLLTEIGGFRDSTLVGHYSDIPQQYDYTVYGGYYTKSDVHEVIEYAEKLNIEVVPEIELPGHSSAALAAYPELSCLGEVEGVPGTWGVFEDIYCTKEPTILFLHFLSLRRC